MESFNVFKGYGKVNSQLEDQIPHQQRTASRQRIILLGVSSIIVLTLVIGLLLGALIFEEISEPPETPVEAIKEVCLVSSYPTACFTSISSLNTSTKPDPEAIFMLSLQVSITEVKSLSSSLAAFNDVTSQAAISDCVSLLDDSLSRLNDSFSAMKVGSGEKMLTVEKVNDIKTWISAAMTDQETCIDGLEETGSKLVDEMKAKMENSKNFLSTSLAIITKMPALLEQFELKMH